MESSASKDSSSSSEDTTATPTSTPSSPLHRTATDKILPSSVSDDPPHTKSLSTSSASTKASNSSPILKERAHDSERSSSNESNKGSPGSENGRSKGNFLALERTRCLEAKPAAAEAETRSRRPSNRKTSSSWKKNTRRNARR